MASYESLSSKEEDDSVEQLFSFEAMKRTLSYIVSPDECEELTKYIGVTEEEMGTNQAGDEDKSKELSEKKKTVKKMKCLLTIIGERGRWDAYNINHLKNAIAAISHGKVVSNLLGPMEGYVLHGLSIEMMAMQKAWEGERNQLGDKLRTAEMKTNEYEKTVEAKDGELKKMEKIKILTEEQDQTKTESNETTERLTEDLTQTKESLDSSREKIKMLTGELGQTKTESTKTVETLTVELQGCQKK